MFFLTISCFFVCLFFFFQAEDGIRDAQESRGLGDVYKRQTHISPIISSRCISCHSGNNPQAGLLLENYNQVRNSSENGLLIQRINDPADPMPVTGLMPLSTRVLFDEWSNNGYLEN